MPMLPMLTATAAAPCRGWPLLPPLPLPLLPRLPVALHPVDERRRIIARQPRPLPSMTSPVRPLSRTMALEPPQVAAARDARDAQLAAWLAASAGGDAGAFEFFYEATFAYARTVARRMLRETAEIEDLLADCYFEAWRTAVRFDAARGSPVTWLLTLVRSRGLDALRAARAGPQRVPAPGAASEGSEPTPPELAAAGADPADALWHRQCGAELHAALATLSAPERWVLGLAYLRELSHAEIAQCTGMPLGTVKSHALRAQNKLRKRLAPGPRGGLGAVSAWRTAS